MKRYNEYKQTGIKWFNEIPSSWNIKRIKDLSSTKSGTTPLSRNIAYYENGIYNWIRTTDLNDTELIESEYKVTQLAVDECNLTFIPVDSILLAMYGGFGTIGKNAILKLKSTINQSVCAILPKQRLFNSVYLFYFFKYFRKEWRLFADGARKDPNINQEVIKNLFVAVPPLNEQKIIANFLSAKISAIENELSVLKEKNEKYSHLKKKLIKKVVCEGLDENVTLKNSDIEWIERYPNTWLIKRGKDIFTEISKSGLAASEGEEIGDYPFYTSSLEQSKRINNYSHSGEAIIFSTGGTASVHYVNGKFGVSTDCWLIKSNKCVSRYYAYFYKSILFEINQLAFKGAGLEHLQRDFIMAGKVLFPPLEEQMRIADYLDSKTNIIDSIISNIKSQITLLKELKTTLISDVVMGNINVTN